MNFSVEILLSTYNGEKYLSSQLESILEQDYQNWKLVIRDDGSTDGTLAILNGYIQKYPEKLCLLSDNDGNLGYSGSFTKLLKQSSAAYIMFCDQDDYWLRTKISMMLSVIVEEETDFPGIPHLVFSDLQMSDTNLAVVFPSFLNKAGYTPDRGVQIFFLKNYVPGCSMMFNRKLVLETLKTENIINLHDHWLALVCAATGKLTCIEKPLMKYRMHDNNAIGFLEADLHVGRKISLFFKDILKYCFSNKKYRDLLYLKNIRQLQNICAHLGASVSKDAIGFSQIDKRNYFKRKIKNLSKPYILEKSLLKQLTYIICF